MRICHFSDSHLGAGENHPRRAAGGLTERQEDIIRSFVEAVERIIAIKPEICIHSGDLFHAVRPSNRIIATAAEQFHRLASVSGIPTVLITGNHDAPKQPHIGAAIEIFEHIENLNIVAGSEMRAISIGKAKVFALPHCLTTALQVEQLKRCVPDISHEYNLLVMHGAAAGMPEFSMAELGEQELPLEVMAPFDYTALGHFHNFRQVSERAYYSGSTERLSQSEREEPKGFVIVDLDPFRVTFQEVSCRPMVDLAPVDAFGKRGDQLVKLIQEQVEKIDSSDKIVRVKVVGVTEETLKTIPLALIAELRQKSFSLDIDFEKAETQDSAQTFGRSAIGRLDVGFAEYVKKAQLEGFDKERLIKEGLKYLSDES